MSMDVEGAESVTSRMKKKAKERDRDKNTDKGARVLRSTNPKLKGFNVVSECNRLSCLVLMKG